MLEVVLKKPAASGSSGSSQPYYSPMDVEMANDLSGSSQGSGSGSQPASSSRYYDPIRNQYTRAAPNRRDRYFNDIVSTYNPELPFSEMRRDEAVGSTGSSTTGKRKRHDDTFYSLADTARPQSSSWQTSEEIPPLRLGFEQGSASGSGYGYGSGSGLSLTGFTARDAGAGGSQLQSLGSSPSSERMWKRDTDEVAGFLLGTEGDNNSQFNSFTSSGMQF